MTQAALRGHDEFQALDAGSPELAGAELHARGAELGVDGRHTYLPADDGWPHLAIVPDRFKRAVVGRSIKPRTTADIVTDALAIAWFRRKPGAGAVIDSDRGSEHASQAMTSKMVEYAMTTSMRCKGNCRGNAPTRSFFNGPLLGSPHEPTEARRS